MNSSTPAQAFPTPLADFIETDRDGYTSLSYPMMVGRLYSILHHIDDDFQHALGMKGSARTAALARLAKSIAEDRRTTDLIDAQWDAELESRRQRREARKLCAVQS